VTPIPLKTSVLINNYNYVDYVGEAIRSTLKQTQPPDEIIVVDDGSTDDSVARIREEFGNEARVKIICQENRGQLSAFHAGHAVATGDVVFFLDADDVYDSEYIAEAVAFYDQHPECDFLHCGMELFGDESGFEMYQEHDCDHGFSVIEAISTKHFRGSPTSTISLRRTILDQILPLPLESNFRNRADDCLVWGAGVVGAHKFFIARPLVGYRVHGSNAFRGVTATRHDTVSRRYGNLRMIGVILARCQYHLPRLLDFILEEFESSATGRSASDLRRYRAIVRDSGRSLRWRIKTRRKLSRAYARMQTDRQV
jgi:glycosyltransferase involved in cell wall biosynthesis